MYRDDTLIRINTCTHTHTHTINAHDTSHARYEGTSTTNANVMVHPSPHSRQILAAGLEGTPMSEWDRPVCIGSCNRYRRATVHHEYQDDSRDVQLSATTYILHHSPRLLAPNEMFAASTILRHSHSRAATPRHYVITHLRSSAPPLNMLTTHARFIDRGTILGAKFKNNFRRYSKIISLIYNIYMYFKIEDGVRSRYSEWIRIFYLYVRIYTQIYTVKIKYIISALRFTHVRAFIYSICNVYYR